MNIFLESNSLQEIREAAAAGLVQGVSFSPNEFAFADPEGDQRERLEELSHEFAIPICVTIGALNGKDIYREARDLAKISDHIVVQIPLMEDALPAMFKLNAEGVGICSTLVFNGAQALLAAKAGASMVRVSMSDLDAQGQESTETIAEIRHVLEASGMESDVMAASPQTPTQVVECVTAGANIISLSSKVIRSLLVHPLTDRGLDRFLSDLSKRPKRHS